MSQVEIARLDRALQQAQADALEVANVAEAGKRLEVIEGAYCGSSLTTRNRIGRYMLKPKRNNNYLNHAGLVQEARIAQQERDRELYGDALKDVEFLRRCGWAINVLAGGGVMFGNQILTLDELRQKAERERRLRQPAPAPIGATTRA